MENVRTRTIHDDARELAELAPTESPLVSCYLDLRDTAPVDWRGALIDRYSQLRRALDGENWQDIRQCFDRIRAWMCYERNKSMKGVAIFVREGSEPFFLAREFNTPVPTFIAIDDYPDIYHLVEMKETFHRYIVVSVQPDWARVLEVNLGAATLENLKDHPETRDRVADELTHTHYARHGDFREGPFVLEVIESVNKLVELDGHKHLLLTGDAEILSCIETMLPPHIHERVVEVLHLDEGERPDVVAETIHHFTKHLEDSSRALIDVFRQSFYRDELAIAGLNATFKALDRGQVDSLLLSEDVQPAVTWRCDDCGHYAASHTKPHACPECGSNAFSERDTLGELVRLAEISDAEVEYVRGHSLLDRVGGVGALLRWA